MARLSIQSAGLPVQVIELKLGTNRLGRAADNDFTLEHPTISSHHCEITWLNETVTIKDLQSTNGTFIDGQPIQQSVLEPGHSLRLGKLDLVLESAQAEIAIPEVRFEAPPTPTLLPDGAPACLNHADVAAVFECVQCHLCFCDGCVRELRRVGGAVLHLCPACSGRCDPLPGKVETLQKKRPTFLGLLQETLRIVTGRPRS
ncbi:MAG: FHA domain-containing protein [Verrucomicrobia bacterium]|nr:FHA domain-containing protein [Verrucomicrobiota bacterium]